MAAHWSNPLIICLAVMIITQAHAAGKEVEIGGLKAYETGPKDSKIAVILSPDVFGFEIPHLRQIADKVGAIGIYTLVPDFFNGDPFVSNKSYDDWLAKHRPEKGIKDIEPVIKALRSKGIDKIGAAGFCWGGKVTVDLSKTPSVQVAVLLHPTFVEVKDIQGVNVPTAILGGQNDNLVSPNLLKQFESILKTKEPKVDSFLKIFPKAEHGWTTKYNETDETSVKRAVEAHNDMLNWFKKYLK